MKNKISISIRLSARDGDILKVFRCYKPAEALSIAVSKHLGDQKASLSISGITPVPPGVYKVRIDAELFPEEFKLISSIPKGNRSTAAKRLLRYAIPYCDLEYLMASMPSTSQAAKRPKIHAVNPSVPKAEPSPHKEAPPPSDVPPNADGDDIFNLI